MEDSIAIKKSKNIRKSTGRSKRINGINKAKEVMLNNKSDEIEELKRKHDTFKLHKKIKVGEGTRKQQHHGIVENRNGKPITEIGAQVNKVY